jgi:hypothetical protein
MTGIFSPLLSAKMKKKKRKKKSPTASSGRLPVQRQLIFSARHLVMFAIAR